jgi:hypothetical protein
MCRFRNIKFFFPSVVLVVVVVATGLAMLLRGAIRCKRGKGEQHQIPPTHAYQDIAAQG